MKYRYYFIVAVIIVILLAFIVAGGNSRNTSPNTVKIKTSMGDITIELYPDKAPITVANFESYVDSGFYDNLIFHRVIKGFMIQGGGFDVNGMQKKTDAPIKLESNNGLSNEKYTIAMARTNIPDSATSQFFINTADNTFLDYSVQSQGYAVFGKVVEGQDVVDSIENARTASKGYGKDDWPVDNIVIYSIELM